MDSLCDICQTIPFRELQDNPDQEFKTIVGDYYDIKRRAPCLFCCFVCRVVEEMACTEFNSVDECMASCSLLSRVEVIWLRDEQAFKVYGLPLRYTRGSSRPLGRLVKPTPVPVDQIVPVLEDCDTSHQCSLLIPIPEEDAGRLSVLRAIDVRRMCVTQILPSTRYVTLSYVWGGIAMPRLLQTNKEKLMAPGGLEIYKGEIPSTIRDAIELVRRMNLEYLWVDALCLVQDDAEEMTSGINAMSWIYENSYLTVVAADGNNAEAGLAGIRPRRPCQITVEILPGVELVSGANWTAGLLGNAYYSSRAWTFQEYHSSRRCLIFIGDMIHYICEKSCWIETISGGLASFTIDKMTKPSIKELERDRLITEYRTHLLGYCWRNSTYEYDIIRAVTSIYYKMLGKQFGHHISGVPIAAFDSFMCFCYPEDKSRFLERRASLPSWAWVGWKGEVRWLVPNDDDKVLEWMANCTWIIWYIRDSVGDVSLLWDLHQTSGEKFTASTEEICAKRMAKIQEFSANPLPTVPSLVVPQIGLLQFWTFSAHFNIRVDSFGEEHVGKLEWGYIVAQQIFGLDGKYHGLLHVDEESSKRDNDNVEIIVISEAASSLSSHDYNFWYTDGYWSHLRKLEDRRLYNVLYVEEKLGVAERKGFGQIYCEEIRISPESMWQWKEMVLR